jgi:deoxyhypusine synthase
MASREPLRTPTTPLSICPPWSLAQLLERMGGTSFQARNLHRATRLWEEMLKGETLIFFGLAGAMVPAGLRPVITYLIKNRLIDCVVSTGANLFHDLHESLGFCHFQGEPGHDEDLRQAEINRIYDTLLRAGELEQGEDFIARFSSRLPPENSVSTREYLHLLGKELSSGAKAEGILVSAYKNGVPIFCPALADSVFGTALAGARVKYGCELRWDLAQDVLDMIQLCARAPATGVVLVGGGTPKNFIQQAPLCVGLLGQAVRGHKYAVQITTDSPQWGGLSGCTFEEARSWGKIAKGAGTVAVYADATIALPLMVSALAERCQAILPRKGLVISLG